MTGTIDRRICRKSSKKKNDTGHVILPAKEIHNDITTVELFGNGS